MEYFASVGSNGASYVSQSLQTSCTDRSRPRWTRFWSSWASPPRSFNFSIVCWCMNTVNYTCCTPGQLNIPVEISTLWIGQFVRWCYTTCVLELADIVFIFSSLLFLVTASHLLAQLISNPALHGAPVFICESYNKGYFWFKCRFSWWKQIQWTSL